MQPPFGMSARALSGAVAAILLTTIVAVVGAFTWWQALQGSSGSEVRVTYGLGACRAFEEPVGADGYQAAGSMAMDPWLLGADVGVSARLTDGRMLWAFGDTFRSPDGRSTTAVRNSMVIAGQGCRRVVLAPDGRAVIPDRPDGVGYWPMSMVVVPDEWGSLVHVFAERVRGREQAFAFTNLGPAIATYAVPSGEPPELISVADLGADSEARTTVGWGAATAPGADGYVYIYGTANPDQPLVFGWSVRVARADPTDLLDPRTWEYWTGGEWSTSPDAAVPVVAAEGGVSQTFSVIERGGQWYAISKRDGDLGTELAVWSAPAPWGPFADPVTVGRIPNDDDPSILRYMPLAHPDARQSSPQHMLVSVSRNSLDPLVLANFPRLYRPFFVDIDLPPQPSERDLDPRG